ESVSILIGKLLNAGELSFNKNPNQISKKVKGNWVDVKAISSDYTPEERKRYFIEFLTSDSGEALLADLRKSEADLPKSEVKEPVKGTAPVIDPPAPTELEKAEMLLKEAQDSGASDKTIQKFQDAVDELKSNS
ncbi:MAG TPA: hypothetical protein VJ279_06030, partial [Hanamia sp.]|nr:hypothetical protein [Hanamia sp.]